MKPETSIKEIFYLKKKTQREAEQASTFRFTNLHCIVCLFVCCLLANTCLKEKVPLSAALSVGHAPFHREATRAFHSSGARFPAIHALVKEWHALPEHTHACTHAHSHTRACYLSKGPMNASTWEARAGHPQWWHKGYKQYNFSGAEY